MSIYVEILVRASMDALWRHTQTPALHEKWDLRFSRIEYLPKESETEPQRSDISVFRCCSAVQPKCGNDPNHRAVHASPGGRLMDTTLTRVIFFPVSGNWACWLRRHWCRSR